MNTQLQECREKVAIAIDKYVKEYGVGMVKHSSEIRKYLEKNIGTLDVMFQESDMCYDKTNKANLKTYSTDILLFESTDKRGYFRILGKNYKYTGPVQWIRKGKDKPDVVVGKWDDGKLNYWGDSIDPENPEMSTNSAHKTKNDLSTQDATVKNTREIRKNADKAGKGFDVEAIRALDIYLKKEGIADIKNDNNAVIERSRGKVFSFQNHLRGLIYALLTNQRKWSDVEPKLPQIDKLFFDYEISEIKGHDGKYYEDGIRNLRCGNISIKAQMKSLHHNIEVLEKISRDFGSLDDFVISEPAEEIVRILSNSGSRYKIEGLGVALAWEYLRNVGIDGGKPDTHLRRFFGNERIGISSLSNATENEVLDIIDQLAREGEYNRFEIDYLIWCYCASGKGDICSVSPKCDRCVIRNYCRRR